MKIKTFYGYSDNVVRTQVWIAVCTYVLAAIVKKELKLESSLSQMLRIISVSVFEIMPLLKLFTEDNNPSKLQIPPTLHSNQLCFNLI